jgi:UbiD family decarboxylase
VFVDLREWLEQVEALGELSVVRGASWEHEIGALTDTIRTQRGEQCPALLFDQIEGYPAGFRVLANSLDSVRRTALTLGLPLGRSKRDYAGQVWDRLRDNRGIPPKVVEDGPVLQNVMRGPDVDLYRFPAPHWHEKDGGRYIGTGDCVITRSPEQPHWVNVGTYRVSLIDRSHLFIYISPGKHGGQHRDAYLAAGQECPVAISFGQDPLLWTMATQALPAGVSEFDYAGGLRGEPTEVVTGPVTGLPLPARGEIVVEGFITPDKAIEGPFERFPEAHAVSAELRERVRGKWPEFCQ